MKSLDVSRVSTNTRNPPVKIYSVPGAMALPRLLGS
jgi:hypothetical protein